MYPISLPLRRPKVNPKAVGSGNNANDKESYEEMLKKTCKRCSIRMIRNEDTDNWICQKCMWEPPIADKKREKIKAEMVEADIGSSDI